MTALLVSSGFVDAPLLGVTVQPNPENQLQKPSQVCAGPSTPVFYSAATLPENAAD
ncbi:hypothetical protein [Polaromonas sp. CG9_12]|nr:hypothetical protein [Polaromonas sp. CG9_12]